MKFLHGFVVGAFLIAYSHSYTLNQCGEGIKLPKAVRIIGCDEKAPCAIPGFAQPTIAYQVDFVTPKILKDVSLESRITVKNIDLPYISNWKESTTVGPRVPVKKGVNVTYSSKIHYVGYEWWLPKAEKKPLKAMAKFSVKDKNKVLYCAVIPIEFTYCITDCPEIFEEFKDDDKPLNIPPYKPAESLPWDELESSEEDDESTDRPLPTYVPPYVPPFEDLTVVRSNYPWDWVMKTPKLPWAIPRPDNYYN